MRLSGIAVDFFPCGPFFAAARIFQRQSFSTFFPPPGHVRKIGKSKTLQPEKVGKLLDHCRRFFQKPTYATFSTPTPEEQKAGRIFLQLTRKRKQDMRACGSPLGKAFPGDFETSSLVSFFVTSKAQVI